MGTNRNSLTSNKPGGVTNAAEWQTMGQAGLLDPTWAHTFATDFDQYNSADWSITGTGTPAASLIAGDGGILQLATTAGASDSIFFQKTPAAFSVPPTVATSVPGKQLFFKFAGTLSAVNGAFYCGIADISEGAEGSTVDGILINKAAGVGTLTLDIFVASAKTSFAFPTVCTIAAATYVELGFWVDGYGNVSAFWNPTTGNNPISAGVIGVTASRGAVVVAATPTLPTTNMAPVVGYTNASAVAQTVKVDYLVVSKER
jgi:hypothetical protein